MGSSVLISHSTLTTNYVFCIHQVRGKK